MKGRKPGTIMTGADALQRVPSPPSSLTGTARNEWKRVARILVERRHLTAADLGALESYCVAIGMRDDARQTLTDFGSTTYTAGALIKQHPAVGILKSALDACARFGAELGLSPVSRSRVTTLDSDAEDLSHLD